MRTVIIRVGTLVLEDRIWAFPHSSVLGRRSGRLAITLDPSRHAATITVGEQELLLRYQQGE